MRRDEAEPARRIPGRPDIPEGRGGAGGSATGTGGTAGFWFFLRSRAEDAVTGFLAGIGGAARLVGVFGAARLVGVFGAARVTGLRAAARFAGVRFEAGLDARAAALVGFLAGFLRELTPEPMPPIRTCLHPI